MIPKLTKKEIMQEELEQHESFIKSLTIKPEEFFEQVFKKQELNEKQGKNAEKHEKR